MALYPREIDVSPTYVYINIVDVFFATIGGYPDTELESIKQK
jgi:hypothetical protein